MSLYEMLQRHHRHAPTKCGHRRCRARQLTATVGVGKSIAHRANEAHKGTLSIMWERVDFIVASINSRANTQVFERQRTWHFDGFNWSLCSSLGRLRLHDLRENSCCDNSACSLPRQR